MSDEINKDHLRGIQIGVAIIGAVFADPDDTSLAEAVTRSYLAEGENPAMIVAGLVNVAGTLLAMMHMAGMGTPQQILQFVSRAYLTYNDEETP